MEALWLNKTNELSEKKKECLRLTFEKRAVESELHSLQRRFNHLTAEHQNLNTKYLELVQSLKPNLEKVSVDFTKRLTEAEEKLILKTNEIAKLQSSLTKLERRDVISRELFRGFQTLLTSTSQSLNQFAEAAAYEIVLKEEITKLMNIRVQETRKIAENSMEEVFDLKLEELSDGYSRNIQALKAEHAKNKASMQSEINKLTQELKKVKKALAEQQTVMKEFKDPILKKKPSPRGSKLVSQGTLMLDFDGLIEAHH